MPPRTRINDVTLHGDALFTDGSVVLENDDATMTFGDVVLSRQDIIGFRTRLAALERFALESNPKLAAKHGIATP